MTFSLPHVSRLIPMWFVPFIMSVTVWLGCQDSTTPLDVKLNLTIHMQTIDPSWWDQDRIQITLFTANHHEVNLNDQIWSFEGDEAQVELKGTWRAPFRFVVDLTHLGGERESATDMSRFECLIEAAPQLDYLKQLIFEDDPKHSRTHIYLQPLSFLQGLDVEAKEGEDDVEGIVWSDAMGLDPQFWWWRSIVSEQNEMVNRTEDPYDQTRLIISNVWRWLSTESEWSETLFHEQIDERLRPWLMLKRITTDQGQLALTSHSQSERLETWGLSFYDELLRQLSGQKLSPSLAQILSSSTCAPWRFVTPFLSERFNECLDRYVGLYVERPQPSGTDISNLDDASISSRIISLDGSPITDLQLTLLDPWDRVIVLEDRSIEEVDDQPMVIGQRTYPIKSIQLKLPHHLINRPTVHIRLQGTNQKGAQSDQQWTLALWKANTIKLIGVASILDPVSHGVVSAMPLDEYIEIPNLETKWDSALDVDGEFEIMVKGYHGPLLVTVTSNDDQRLMLITSMITSINQSDPFRSYSPQKRILWLSPLSTLITWLNITVFKDILNSAGLVEQYQYLDQEQSWLTGHQSVTLVNHDTLIDHRMILDQVWTAHERWMRCGLGLVSQASNVDDLDEPWRLTQPPLDHLLSSLALALPFEKVSVAMTHWVEALLSGCLQTQINQGISADLGPLRRLALSEVLQGRTESIEGLTQLGTEITLNSGVWFKSSGVWWLSEGHDVELSFTSSRGVMSVALGTMNPSFDLPQLNTTPSQVSREVCPWSLLTNGRSDRRWQWGEGEWAPLVMTELNGLFNEPLSGDSIGWRWSNNQIMALPLPCHLSLYWDEIESSSDLITLEISSQLWGSADSNQLGTHLRKQLHLTMDQSAPRIEHLLDDSSGDWVLVEEGRSHWVSPTTQNTSRPITLHLTSVRPVICEASDQRSSLEDQYMLGDLQLARPVALDMESDSTLQNSPLLDWLPPLPSRWAEPVQRYARHGGGAVFSDRFIGAYQQQLKLNLEPTLEGSSSIFVRCEDGLGQASITRSTFTVDTEVPRIVHASLSGVNEAVLQATLGQTVPGVARSYLSRHIDLLDRGEERIKWGRWVTHWTACRESCPLDDLRSLILTFRAQDTVWKSTSLKAYLDADIYILDEQGERIQETTQRLSLEALNADGVGHLNIFDLLYNEEWTGLPPSFGESLSLDLTLTIIDPTGHLTALPIQLELVPLAPMVTVNFQPITDPVHTLIDRGDLAESLRGSFGTLQIHNPHDIPIFVALNLPHVQLDINLSTRDVGLPIELSRLLSSCLYNPVLEVFDDHRLINHQLEGDLSISGQCVSLVPTPANEQSIVLLNNDWSSLPIESFTFMLTPHEQRIVSLPQFTPTLPSMISQLILSPTALGNAEFPSPYQRYLFPETSIFQRDDGLCEGCLPSHLLGNRIVSLTSFFYEATPNELIEQRSDALERDYDVNITLQPWSLSVSRFDTDHHVLIHSLLIPDDAQYEAQ